MADDYSSINRRPSLRSGSIKDILDKSMAPLVQKVMQDNPLTKDVARTGARLLGMNPDSIEGKAFTKGNGGKGAAMLVEYLAKNAPGMNIGSPQSLANSIIGTVNGSGLGLIGGSGAHHGSLASGAGGEYAQLMAFEMVTGMTGHFNEGNLAGGNLTTLGVVAEQLSAAGAFNEDTVIRSYDWASQKGDEFEKSKALALRQAGDDQKAIDYINDIKPGSKTIGIDKAGMAAVLKKVEVAHAMAMDYSAAIGSNNELGRPYAAAEAMEKMEQMTGSRLDSKASIIAAGKGIDQIMGLAQANGVPVGAYMAQSETVNSVIREHLRSSGLARPDDIGRVAQNMMPVLQDRAAAVAEQQKALGITPESPVAMTNMAGMIQREMAGGGTDTRAAAAATLARQKFTFSEDQEKSYQNAMTAYGSAKSSTDRAAAEKQLESVVMETTGRKASELVNARTGGVTSAMAALTGDNAKTFTGAMLDHATGKEGRASLRAAVISTGTDRATGIDADTFTGSYERLQQNFTGDHQKNLIKALSEGKSVEEITEIVKASGATAEGLGRSPEAYAAGLHKANEGVSKRSQGRTNLGESLQIINDDRAYRGNATDFYNKGSAERVKERAKPELPEHYIDKTSGSPGKAFIEGVTGRPRDSAAVIEEEYQRTGRVALHNISDEDRSFLKANGMDLPELKKDADDPRLSADAAAGQAGATKDFRDSPANNSGILKVEIVSISADVGDRRNII